MDTNNIYCRGDHQYFLNLCKREHKNATCFDSEGTPIPTFACQDVSGWGHAVDLGSVIGFLPGTELNNVTGFTVELTEGTPGCGGSFGDPFPRATNITMVCDLSAGVGNPQPAYPNNVVEFPPHSCRYHFIWRSLYACPLCTVEDYEISVSDCVNGKKMKTHVRLSDCWDPNPTPPEEISCTSCPSLQGEICSGHGSCNDENGNCNCETHWSGSACEQCAPGFFGAQCENGSICFLFTERENGST